jgi:hypothetical protein
MSIAPTVARQIFEAAVVAAIPKSVGSAFAIKMLNMRILI